MRRPFSLLRAGFGLAVLLSLALVLAPRARAQGIGIFERADCTTLTAPVVGHTYCFDSTANVLKSWNGSTWAAIIPQRSGGGIGLFATTDCTLLTAPVTGQTWCFDQTLRALTVWDGTKYATLSTANNSYIPSITDFGAVGDDATDNTAAITRALASLQTTGDSGTVGGQLYVPPGIYRHSGTITWPNKDFVIAGASDLVSVFRYTGAATGNQINSDGSTFPNKFRDLAFVSTATNGTLWNVQGGGRVIFDDVRFRADSGSPILLRTTGNAAGATQQTTLRNVYLNCNSLATIGLQVTGTALPGSATTNVFGGRINQCTQGAGVGLDAATAEGLNVYGTNIEGNLIGVRLDGVRGVLLDGLWYESNTTADVQVKSTTVSTLGVVVRNGHWASSAIPINIDVQTPGVVTRGVRILNNSFSSAATTANIRIQSGVTDSVIGWNTFSNATEISDAGTRTMKVGNVTAGNVLTPMQTNPDAGVLLIATGTTSNGIAGTTKVQLNSTSAGATAIPLALTNAGSAATSTAVGQDFTMNYSAGEDTYGRLLVTATNVAGGTRSGQMDLMTNVNSNLSTIARLGAGLQIGGTGGLPTGGDKGTGTVNIASATFMNGSPFSVASATGTNLVQTAGISQTSTSARNLRGTCTFPASSQCVVTFANNEPDTSYFVALGCIGNITSKGVNGFTINATASTSNTCDWHVLR